MKVLIVLECEVDERGDMIPAALKAIDPPSVPGFTGTARIVVEPHATQLQKWLDEE